MRTTGQGGQGLGTRASVPPDDLPGGEPSRKQAEETEMRLLTHSGRRITVTGSHSREGDGWAGPLSAWPIVRSHGRAFTKPEAPILASARTGTDRLEDRGAKLGSLNLVATKPA